MIFTRLDANGTEFYDAKQIQVTQETSDNNTASSFSFNINNQAGINKDTFTVTDNIKIYAGQAPMDKCIGHWRMNKGSGNIVTNIFNNQVGSILGTYAWTDDNGSSLYLSGTTGRVAVYDPSGIYNLGSCDNYAVSCWFNTVGSLVDQSISEHWEGGGYPWAIRGPNDYGVGFGIYDSSVALYVYTDNAVTGSLNDGNWHHVVGVRDYTNRTIIMYVDNQTIGSITDVTNGNVSSSSNGFAIGARQMNGDKQFKGKIKDFRIFSRTLSPNDVNYLYNMGSIPVNKCLINGFIESLDNYGEANTETIDLSGRDYSAVMQDVTVTPRVYKDMETSKIVKDIMATCCPTITTNNVTKTTTTIDRIVFNHMNVFDSLIRLAQVSGFYFWVDTDGDLNFRKRSITDSGYTFDNTNSISDTVMINDREVYNKVWVYGTRILTGVNEEFTANGGSVFQLTDKPHNTVVYYDGFVQLPGGVININDPATENVKYVVDYDQRKVIAVSGASAGDNIPISGAIVSINYDRSTPIIKYAQDDLSVIAFGPKVKVINDDSITTFEQATNRANTFLAENKDIFAQADLLIKGFPDVIPGQLSTLNYPFQNVTGSVSMLGLRYNFNPDNQASERVLTIKLNKRIYDLTDTIKEMILAQRQLETGDINGEVSEFKLATGSTFVKTHWNIYTIDINNAFLFHTSGHDLLNSPTSLLGNMLGDPALLTSGGNY